MFCLYVVTARGVRCRPVDPVQAMLAQTGTVPVVSNAVRSTAVLSEHTERSEAVRYPFASHRVSTDVPRESTVRIVRELANRGYNADREAMTLLAGASDPSRAVERAVETAPDDALVLSAEHVREALDKPPLSADQNEDRTDSTALGSATENAQENPFVSTADPPPLSGDFERSFAVETGGLSWAFSAALPRAVESVRSSF